MKAKIRVASLLNRLHDHIASKDGSMVPSAVTAALGLLRKVMPDLAAVVHSGQIETKGAERMTDDELAAIAAGSGTSADQAAVDPTKLN